MKIEKIDPNFRKETGAQGNKTCYNIPHEKFDLYGVSFDKELNQFVRMDKKVADKVNGGVSYLCTHTSGGRIRFCTDSSHIGISVSYPSLDKMSHMPLTGSCGFVLLEKIGNTYKTVSVFRPSPEEISGYTGEVSVKEKGKHEYILFFPLYNPISELKIFLSSEATLFEAEKYRPIPPILYYGASIDQGACASRPDSCYPAILSKWNDIDFINLGFSGNCKGEPLMAEYLSGIDCSLLFMAYDGNAPDPEYLENTHFAFYEIYRKVKKDVPIVFMSVPCFENFSDAAKRREVIYNTYLKARQMGDKKVYFIDGETLFGQKDREICTVEGCHPTDLGFYRIAEKINELYEEILK